MGLGSYIPPNDNESGGGDGGENAPGSGDPGGTKPYVPGYVHSGDSSERSNLLLEEQNQDLHHEQIETLGTYLSNLTAGLTKGASQPGPDHPGYGGSEFKNEFHPAPGSTEFGLKDADGSPAAIVTAGPGYDADGASRFIDGLSDSVEEGTYGSNPSFPPRNESQVGSLDRYSNSGMFDGAEPKDSTLVDILDKRTQKQGHHLLTDVKRVGPAAPGNTIPSPGETIVQKKISGVLKHNRFSPGPATPFIADGEFTRSEFGTFQKTLGVYNPNATELNRKGMARVGVSLGLLASGHGELDPHASTTEYAAMLPSLVQMAMSTVDVEDLRPISAHMGKFQLPIPGMGGIGLPGGGDDASMEDEAKKDNMSRVFSLSGDSAKGVTIGGEWGNTSRNNKSYGQLNSPKEPFGGVLPEGTMMVAAAGMIALIAASFGLKYLLKLIPFGAAGKHTPNSPQSLRKGHWHEPGGMDLILRYLGIPPFRAPFGDCLNRGIQVFYGISSDLTEITAEDFLKSGLNLMLAPGYYAVILRNVIRDTEQIKDSAADIPPIPTPSSILKVLTSLTESATFKFLMTMAVIGEKCLESDGVPTFSPTGKPIDLIDENPGTRMAKSRVGRGGSWEGKKTAPNDRRLVWRHGALPSRYLLPESFLIASQNWNMPTGQGAHFMGRLSKKMTSVAGDTAQNDWDKPGEPAFNATTDGRIDPGYVKFIENELEMEYMPFYFHDLRTNEIVAFHAFLDSVENSFSPEWTSSSGYGRMDDVMIYTKTTREVSVSFMLAATSPEDFDNLWWDVNKLTTLIYPQWSGGKQVKSGKESWIQPFSQIPTSSPIIRLRVGDLVKTNYSRFNLARLFGLGENPNSDAEGKFHIEPVQGEEAKAADAKAMAEWKADVQVVADKAEMGTGAEGTGHEEGSTVVMMPGSRHPYKFGTEMSLVGDDLYNKNIEKMMISTTGDQKVLVVRSWQSMAGGPAMPVAMGVNPFYDGKAKNDYTETRQWYTVKLTHEFENGKTDDHHFAVNFDELKYDWDGHKPGPPGGSPLTDAEKADAVPNFFKPENNAIVRSFESSMSRGLAGAITSFGMDSAEAPWETSELGSRAPIWVKISITMKVIHDIPPGLDKDGFNRAPIFNVGKAVNAMSGDAQFGVNFANMDDELVKKFKKLRNSITEIQKDGD